MSSLGIMIISILFSTNDRMCFRGCFHGTSEYPGLQAKLIASLKEKNVPYVFVIPYHPDKIFFSGKRPEELLAFIEKEYTVRGSLPMKGTLYVRN